MTKHRWSVGLLSEMAPEGKVGISPMCILGVNINMGQEISLRLRTDDLKGFRRCVQQCCTAVLYYNITRSELRSTCYETMLCCETLFVQPCLRGLLYSWLVALQI